MILKIRLINFTKFNDNTFEFGKGINAIVAKNGAGKSSILKAIGIAMFNSYNTPLSKLVKYGKIQSEIYLDFSYNGILYSIYRTFGKKSSVSLKFNDESITGLKSVYGHLSGLFDVDLDHINSNVLMITSHNLTTPFLLRDSDKKVIFDKILGVDKYSKMSLKLRDVQRILKNKLSKLENELLFIERSKKSIEDKIKEVEYLTSEIELLKIKQMIYDDNETLIKRKDVLNGDLEKLKLEYNTKIKAKKTNEDSYGKLKQNICYTCGNPINGDKVENMKDSILNKIQKLEIESDILYNNMVQLKSEIESIKYIDAINYRNQLLKMEAKVEILQNDINNGNNLSDVSLKLNINEIKSKLDFSTRIRDGLAQIPTIIIDNMATNVSLDSSKNLSSLMGNEVEVSFTKDYNTGVLIDDNELDFTQLSSGQAVLTALSIRMSLVNRLSEFDFLMLDEPTVNLDSTHRALLVDNIKQIGFDQIFVITHDDSFINISDMEIKL